MAIDIALFKPLVRRQAGSPGVCEIDDDTIEDKVNEALEAYSRLNPLRVIEPVAFVANQAAAAFPSGCFEVNHEVQVEEGSSLSASGSSRSLDLTGFGYDSNSMGFLSSIHSETAVRMAQHMDESSRQTFPSLSFHERGGMIYVTPPPSVSETYYVPLLKKHELANFPTQDEWILRELSAGFVLKYRAFKYKFTEASAADGRRKIKFGDIRNFFTKEGDAKIEKVAQHFGVMPSSIG